MKTTLDSDEMMEFIGQAYFQKMGLRSWADPTALRFGRSHVNDVVRVHVNDVTNDILSGESALKLSDMSAYQQAKFGPLTHKCSINVHYLACYFSQEIA